MADDSLLTFSDAIHRTAHDLAGMSGVDMAKAGPATCTTSPPATWKKR
ncbi:hypothetical protein [Stenotrophomonas sp. AB1(2024)]